MRKRKVLAVLTLCVFMFTIAATGAVAQQGVSNVDFKVNGDGSVQVTMNFEDMNQAQWALKHVMKMKSANIITGYQDGSFKPNKPVTHAETVVMTMKAAGLQNEIDSMVVDSVYLPFKDAGQIPFWAQKAVALAVKKGYLDAGASGNFQANKAASREWTVKLIAKALGIQPVSVQLPFTDAGKISPDAAGYVAAVVYKQLISGFPDGSFQPNKPVTRAEMAVMLGLTTDEMPIPGKIACKIKGTVVSVSTEVYENVYSSVYSNMYSQGTITLQIAGDDENKDEDEGENENENEGRYTGTVTFPVAQDALIYVDEKSAALKDIPVGAEAQVIVNKEGMVEYAEVAPVTVKGVVQAVYNDQLTITLGGEHERNRNRHHGPSGGLEQEQEQNQAQTATYTVVSGAPVVINSVSTTLAGLLPGDVVKLTLNAEGKVISIKGVRFVQKDIDEDEKDTNKDNEHKNQFRDKEENKDKIKDKNENNNKNKPKNEKDNRENEED